MLLVLKGNVRPALFLPIFLLLGCGAASVAQYSDKHPRPIPEGESRQGRACLDAAEAKWAERQRTRSPELFEGNGTAAPSPDTESEGVLRRSSFENAAEKDLLITRDIRRALLAEDSLSFEAKNIKILITNGRVTLRGVVDEREREAIERIAAEIAGHARIDNQL